MKKIKFLGAAVLAASLIFAGCSSPAGIVPEGIEPIDNNNQTGENNNGQNNNGQNNNGQNNNGQNNNNNQNTNNGGNEDKPHNYTAPAITDYYKNYLVSSPATASNKALGNWGAGSEATPNGDGTLTISASGSMWGGVGGVCAPFSGLEAGSLANYEYIVFTIDTTNYVINNTDDGAGNCGVNIKVPDVQKDISNNYVENGKVRTYYAPMSLFESAPETANEFAIIIGGSGSLKLNEVYFAAAEDPSAKAITGIAITPESANVMQGGKLQFTVKDTNHVNITNEVTYTLTGKASEGSSITNGLLTAGTTAGSLTVTATYNVNGKDFNAEASITVMGAMTNLVSSVVLEKYIDSAGGNNDLVVLTDGVATVAKPAGTTGWGEWSSQLFLTVSSNSGSIFETGKKYYISVTLESDADLTKCIWKGDDAAGYLLEQGITLVAGEPKTLVKEVEFTASFENFQCIFAFGDNANAANINVSNIIVYDITE